MLTAKQKSLFEAVQANDINKISKLIKENAKDKHFLEGQDEEGNNVLAIAVKYLNKESTLTTVLAGFKAQDPALLKKALIQTNKQGQSALMHYEGPSAIELVAAFDIDDPPLTKPSFETVLRSIASIEQLDPNDWVDVFSVEQSGNPPLHVWTVQGKSDQVKEAIHFLSSISDETAEKVLKQKNGNRKTVLSLATFYKQEPVIQAVKQIEVQNRLIAQERAAPKVVKSKPTKGLMEKGKEALEKRTQEKRKARLYEAIKTNNVEKIKSRLAKHPELLTSTDQDRNSILGLAFKHANDTQTLKSVVMAFADSEALKAALMHRNNKGELVLAGYLEPSAEDFDLALAGKKKLKPTFDELLKTVNSSSNFSASDWETVLNARQEGGNTVLHTFADAGQEKYMKAVVDIITDPAFSPGAAERILNTENLEGKSPLGLAIYHGQEAVVEILIGEKSTLSLDQKDAILPPKDEITSFNDWVGMSIRTKIGALIRQANEEIDVAKKGQVLFAPIKAEMKAVSWRNRIKNWLTNLFSAKDPNIQTPRSSITTGTLAVEPAKEVLARGPSPTSSPISKKTDPFDIGMRLHAYDKSVKDQPSSTQKFAAKSKEGKAEAKALAAEQAKAARKKK